MPYGAKRKTVPGNLRDIELSLTFRRRVSGFARLQHYSVTRLLRAGIFGLLAAAAALTHNAPAAAAQLEPLSHQIEPGDTWQALALRFGVEQGELQSLNPHPNPARQPTIGDLVRIPVGKPDQTERSGRLARVGPGGILRPAAASGARIADLLAANGLNSVPTPPLYQAIALPDPASLLKEWPIGLAGLELSSVPAQPGRALALRAEHAAPSAVTVTLNSIPFNSFVAGNRVVAVGGTGAFFPAGAPELLIKPEGVPAWSQPWRFVGGAWDFDRVTLTGDAAAIDQASIDAERTRLVELWSVAGPEPLWGDAFQLPIQSFLEVSSNYGARRSYNGGPFRTYHEGVDFSAYGGTTVFAPAEGVVALAEMLYVRGGAVIIDHGLGVYTGYYHLSALLVETGQPVTAGMPIGEVGTTGLSSGNHLHWDLLVAGTWVDAASWREQNLACWILAGWGRACPPPEG